MQNPRADQVSCERPELRRTSIGNDGYMARIRGFYTVGGGRVDPAASMSYERLKNSYSLAWSFLSAPSQLSYKRLENSYSLIT